MFTLLLVVQVIVSISIISLVMLQQGKGADMGAAFGSGASGTVFGSRGSGSFFSRATGILAAVFFINCLLIASPLVRESADSTGSVVDKIEQQQAAEQQAAEQEIIMESLEKLEEEGPDDLPMDIPVLTEETAVTVEVPDVPEAPVAEDTSGDVPGATDPQDAAEDLPQ